MPSSDVDNDAVRKRFGLCWLLLMWPGAGVPSSLSSSLPDVHDALLLPGLEPSIHGRGECGEPDKLISTNAALHSSIWSSSRNEFMYKSLSCENDVRRLRDLWNEIETKEKICAINIKMQCTTEVLCAMIVWVFVQGRGEVRKICIRALHTTSLVFMQPIIPHCCKLSIL